MAAEVQLNVNVNSDVAIQRLTGIESEAKRITRDPYYLRIGITSNTIGGRSVQQQLETLIKEVEDAINGTSGKFTITPTISTKEVDAKIDSLEKKLSKLSINPTISTEAEASLIKIEELIDAIDGRTIDIKVNLNEITALEKAINKVSKKKITVTSDFNTFKNDLENINESMKTIEESSSSVSSGASLSLVTMSNAAEQANASLDSIIEKYKELINTYLQYGTGMQQENARKITEWMTGFTMGEVTSKDFILIDSGKTNETAIAIRNVNTAMQEYQKTAGQMVASSANISRALVSQNTGYNNARNSIALLSGETQKSMTSVSGNAGALYKEFTDFVIQTNQQTMQGFGDVDYYISNFTKRVLMSGLYIAISKIRQGFSEAFEEMKKVDTELTTIKKVADLSDPEISKYEQKAYRTAASLGTTASAYLNAVSEFTKAGYKEASFDLGELAIKAANVGDTTQEIANAMLLAVDAAYKYEGSIVSLTKVLDGMNEIGNKFPTDVEKISEGLGKVSSIASIAHVGINELSAALGTITAVTQRSGSEAATALRALFLNIIGDTKTEIEDGATWTAGEIEGLRDLMKKYIPDIVEEADRLGKVINPMEAIGALAKAYEEGILKEAELMEMVSDIGGKLRSSQLLTLIQNWGMYQDMLSTYAGADGSANKEYLKYLDSWEAKLNQLKSTWTDFIQKTISSDFIKDALDGIIELIKYFGDLGTALKIVGGLFLALKGQQIAYEINAIGKALKNILSGNFASIIQIIGLATAAVEGALAAVKSSRNKLIDIGNEAADKGKSLQDLYSKWQKLQEESGDSSETVAAREAVADALKAEGVKVDELKGKYNNLDEAIKQATLKQLEYYTWEAKRGEEAAGDSLLATWRQLYADKLTSVGNIVFHGSESTQMQRLMRQYSREYGDEGSFAEWVLSTIGLSNDEEDILEIYDAMVDEAVEMANTGLSNTPKYNALTSIIDALSEDAEKYREARGEATAYEEALEGVRNSEEETAKSFKENQDSIDKSMSYIYGINEGMYDNDTTQRKVSEAIESLAIAREESIKSIEEADVESASKAKEQADEDLAFFDTLIEETEAEAKRVRYLADSTLEANGGVYDDSINKMYEDAATAESIVETLKNRREDAKRLADDIYANYNVVLSSAGEEQKAIGYSELANEAREIAEEAQNKSSEALEDAKEALEDSKLASEELNSEGIIKAYNSSFVAQQSISDALISAKEQERIAEENYQLAITAAENAQTTEAAAAADKAKKDWENAKAYREQIETEAKSVETITEEIKSLIDPTRDKEAARASAIEYKGVAEDLKEKASESASIASKARDDADKAFEKAKEAEDVANSSDIKSSYNEVVLAQSEANNALANAEAEMNGARQAWIIALENARIAHNDEAWDAASSAEAAYNEAQGYYWKAKADADAVKKIAEDVGIMLDSTISKEEATKLAIEYQSTTENIRDRSKEASEASGNALRDATEAVTKANEAAETLNAAEVKSAYKVAKAASSDAETALSTAKKEMDAARQAWIASLEAARIAHTDEAWDAASSAETAYNEAQSYYYKTKADCEAVKEMSEQINSLIAPTEERETAKEYALRYKEISDAYSQKSEESAERAKQALNDSEQALENVKKAREELSVDDANSASEQANAAANEAKDALANSEAEMLTARKAWHDALANARVAKDDEAWEAAAEAEHNYYTALGNFYESQRDYIKTQNNAAEVDSISEETKRVQEYVGLIEAEQQVIESSSKSVDSALEKALEAKKTADEAVSKAVEAANEASVESAQSAYTESQLALDDVGSLLEEINKEVDNTRKARDKAWEYAVEVDSAEAWTAYNAIDKAYLGVISKREEAKSALKDTELTVEASYKLLALAKKREDALTDAKRRRDNVEKYAEEAEDAANRAEEAKSKAESARDAAKSAKESEDVDAAKTAAEEAKTALVEAQEAAQTAQEKYESLNKTISQMETEAEADGIKDLTDYSEEYVDALSEREEAEKAVTESADSLAEATTAAAEATQLAIETATNAAAKDLLGLVSELENAKKAIEDFKNAGSNEHGGVFGDFASMFETALELSGKGLFGSNELSAALIGIFGSDIMESIGFDSKTASGWLQNNDFIKAAFANGGQDYGIGAANYLKTLIDTNSAMKDYIEYTENADGSLNFNVKDAEGLAEQLGVSEGLINAMVDAWSIFDSSLVYSEDSVKKLVEQFKQLGFVIGDNENVDIGAVAKYLFGNGFSVKDIYDIQNALKEMGYTLTDENGNVLENGITNLTEFLEGLSEEEGTEIKITVNDDGTAEAVKTAIVGVQDAVDGLNSNGTATVTVNGAGSASNAESKILSVGTALDLIDGKSATVHVKVDKDGSLPSVETNAKGTDSSRGGLALVNDEKGGFNPELIVDGNRAYIAGGGYPTIVNLSKGATVYTATETRKILGGSKYDGVSIPAYGFGKIEGVPTDPSKLIDKEETKDNGGGGGKGSGKSSSGSGSSSKDTDLLDMVQKYMEDILEEAQNARDEQLKLIEEQLYYLKYGQELSEKSLELEEARMELLEAEQNLVDAQTQRTVRYFNQETGQWEWMADKKAINEAQQSLADAQKGLVNARYDALEEIWSKLEDEIQKAVEKEDTVSLDKLIELMKKSEAADSVDALLELIDDINEFIATTGEGINFDLLNSFDNGGIAIGKGFMPKATREDEVVLDGSLASNIIAPNTSGNFVAFTDALSTMFGIANEKAQSLYNGNGITNNSNGNYYINGVQIGSDMVDRPLSEILSVLPIYAGR